MSTTTISAQTVAELREKTGAGLLDCKKALTEAKGNMEEAITILRKKGAASADKKRERATKEAVNTIAVARTALVNFTTLMAAPYCYRYRETNASAPARVSKTKRPTSSKRAAAPVWGTPLRLPCPNWYETNEACSGIRKTPHAVVH